MPSSIRLLVAGPDKSEHQRVRRALRGRGARFQTSHALGLEDIEACLRDSPFDAALVDLDGWSQAFAAFDHIRQLAPRLPVWAFSHADLAAEARQRGATGFIPKTEHSLKQLRTTITAALKAAESRSTRAALSAQAPIDGDFYHVLFHSIQDALLLCDEAGTILQANIGAENLLGRPAAALVRTRLSRWLGKNTQLNLADLARAEPLRVVLRNGNIPVALRATLLALDWQSTYLVALRDLRSEERAGRLLSALTAAAAAMQGALTPKDVFQAAGDQLRSLGLILSAFRLTDDNRSLTMIHTELLPHVLDLTRRLARVDPLSFPIRIAGSPILQSLADSDGPVILSDSVQVIREMLPERARPLAPTLQRAMSYDEQFAIWLRLEDRAYGLLLVGYPEHLVPEDRPVIAAFGEQIRAALIRADRFEKTQSRLVLKFQELTQLVRVSEQMQVRQPLARLMATICQAIYDALLWGRITIWLRDQAALTWQLSAGRGEAPSPGDPDAAFFDQAGWQNARYRIARSFFIPSAEPESTAWRDDDRLIVPIETTDQRLGAICVASPLNGQRPTPDDVTSLELYANQAAVAIENARLFDLASQRLTQRTGELNALVALSAIGDQSDVQHYLERALAKVLEVAGMDAAALALLDPGRNVLTPHVRQGLSDALWKAMQREPPGMRTGVEGRALEAGGVIIIDDVAGDPNADHRVDLLAEGIHMLVGVGLVGRNPVGSMTLYARARHRLADKTMGWLAVAGHQIALAVENTRLLESMRRRQQTSEAVREVNAAVASNLELEAVLDTILDQVGRVVPYDMASIYQVQAGELHPISVRSLDGATSAPSYAAPCDERVPAWQAVVRREVHVIDDIAVLDLPDTAALDFSARAWIGAPFIAHDEVIGLLALHHRQPGLYSTEDARNVALIAQQAAVAIDNARRFQMARERSERLKLLNDLGRELAVALDRETIFRLAVERIARRLRYDLVSIHLYHEALDSIVLTYAESVSYDVKPVVGQQVAVGVGIVGHTFETGLTYYSGDVRLDPYYVNAYRWDIQSEIAAPLRIEERTIGVLNVESERPNAFSTDDVAMLETLATQIGVALSIADFYGEAQQRAGTLSMLFAASQEFSSSLDSDQVLGRLAQWIVTAADGTSARVYAWNMENDSSRLVAQYVGPRASALERTSMAGSTQRLAELSELVAMMQRRQPVVFLPGREPADAALKDHLSRHNVASALYLPLFVRERLIGCVEVWEAARPRAWSPDTIHLCQTVSIVAAGAIDNARLFEVERQRRSVAEALRDLSAVVSSTLELRPLLDALIDRSAELIPYDSAAVFIATDPADEMMPGGGLRIEVSRGLPQVFGTDWFQQAVRELVADVIRQKRAMLHADVNPLAGSSDAPGIEYIRSWLGVPLVAQGRVAGVLTFASRALGRYRREHLDISETIAAHTAVAVQNGRLFEETRQRLRELDTLRVISLEMIQSLNPERVSQAIADGALRLLQATAVHLFSFDVEADRLQMMAVAAARGYEEIGQPTPRRDGLTMQVARRGQAVVINDPANDPFYAPLTRAWATLGVHAVAGLPLRVRDRVLGVMNVLYHAVHTINDNEVRILELLADQAATALENARLFQTEQLRARQLMLVNRVGLEVTSILDLDQLAQTVVEEIHNAFGYYYVGVATIDSDWMIWRAGAGGDVPGWTPAGMRRPVGSGVVGVAAGGDPIYVRDVRQEPRFIYKPETPRTLSKLALPLKAKGIVIGVLDVEGDHIDGFSAEDVSLLQALASQLSVAVENALLYQALAKHAASLETRVAERTAEIRREQERTFAILNSVADAVLVTDMSGTIALTNPVADTLLLESDADSDDRLRNWLRTLTPDALSPKIEVSNRTWQAAVAYIREDARNVGHVIVMRDITRLEEVDRLKTQFVSTVSHELRTPLTNIKLYLGLFQKGKPEKREQYLATLQSEVTRLERLISDLLDLSRLERGRGSVIYETIDLIEVLRHIAATLAPQAEAKHQTLRLDGALSALMVPADRNQMIQVFVNLVSNAINYTPPAGLIQVSWTAAEQNGRMGAVVSVRDNGVGISTEDRERIFDRFYRGRAEQFDVRGTGLGLAIVKEIVDQHLGQISVESEPGKGSAFTIWLPMNADGRQLTG